MTTPVGCFDCNGTDHWAETCPERTPVKTRKEHDARIEKYKHWWFNGAVRTDQKRRLIEMESDRWRKATERKSA